MQVYHSVLDEMLTDGACVKYGRSRLEISTVQISKERVGKFENSSFRAKIKHLEREQLISRRSIERIKHVRKEERNRLSSARYNANKREEERKKRYELKKLENTRNILMREKEILQREIETFQNMQGLAFQPPNRWLSYSYSPTIQTQMYYYY